MTLKPRSAWGGCGLVVQRLRRRSHTAKIAGSNPAEPIRRTGALPLTRTLECRGRRFGDPCRRRGTLRPDRCRDSFQSTKSRPAWSGSVFNWCRLLLAPSGWNGRKFLPPRSQHRPRARHATAHSPRRGCWPPLVLRSTSPRAKGIDSSPAPEATQDSPAHLGHHVQLSCDRALPQALRSRVLRRRSRRRRP